MQLGSVRSQDAHMSLRSFPPTGLDTLEWIHTYKTAALLKASVASGAVLAGATDREVEQCVTYAQKIGLAFQARSRHVARALCRSCVRSSFM